jgi:hypothetical protein
VSPGSCELSILIRQPDRQIAGSIAISVMYLIRKYMFFSLGVVDLDPDILFRIWPLAVA